ncbi:MAG: hypothetical protein Q9195_007291 [Heterodermia aff. obscurata]
MHETCIEILQRVGQHNKVSIAPDATVNYTSLQGYYDALLRLHDRLTSWPYDDPEAEEQLEKFHPYPSEYGCHKLEWEHQYYGAARFADGSVIPDLTVYILSKLSPIQPVLPLEPPQPVITFTDRSLSSLTALETLSTESLQLITLHAGASAALRLRRCSKTIYFKLSLTQSFWRDHLVSGSLIEYLWDLDRVLCIQKDGQGHWDWKTLAQKLRKPSILENALAKSLDSMEIDDDEKTAFEQKVRQGGEFSDAPMGLRNRCRLVKIVGDIERIDMQNQDGP